MTRQAFRLPAKLFAQQISGDVETDICMWGERLGPDQCRPIRAPWAECRENPGILVDLCIGSADVGEPANGIERDRPRMAEYHEPGYS